jgi:DNA-binding LytR/AlgR family response regulator
MTPDRTPPIGLRDPVMRAPFRRLLIRWTLLFWALAYVYLTLRSMTGSYGMLDVQALLRVPMIIVGLGLCALLYLLLVRIDTKPLSVRVALAGAAVVLRTLAFSVTAYFVFYVWPHIWQSERPFVRHVAAYLVQFVWIFGAWTLLFHYLRHRMLTAAAAVERREFASEFWARQLGKQVRIPVEEIEWIEAEGDYARVHVAANSYLIRSTMQRMEDSLDPDVLMRVHRRAIVARNAIVAASRSQDGRLSVELRGGAVVPVGRRYAKRLHLYVAQRERGTAPAI